MVRTAARALVRLVVDEVVPVAVVPPEVVLALVVPEPVEVAAKLRSQLNRAGRSTGSGYFSLSLTSQFAVAWRCASVEETPWPIPKTDLSSFT